MSDIAEFLLERVADDETVARAATQSIKWWDWPGREERKEGAVRAHEDPYIALNITNGDAAHIARHDPARVLAECEAKRRIVELLQYMDGDPVHGMTVTEMLRLLALPYADHPEYREEWRALAADE